jgi:hypothetical protein
MTSVIQIASINELIVNCNNLLISDPLAQWKCSHCKFYTPSSAVRRVFAVIQSELDQLEYADTGAEAVQNREALWRKYRPVLHPKHAFLMTLRCSLSRLYGHAEGYLLDDLPDILLERKIGICKDILSVADVTEPGLSRLRGRFSCSVRAFDFLVVL